MKKTKLRRKKPLNRVSKKRDKELKEYAVKRRRYLDRHPWCGFKFAKNVLKSCPCGSRASDIHHRFGRNGKRLLDQRYWVGLCRWHHRFLHNNPKQARKVGLLLT